MERKEVSCPINNMNLCITLLIHVSVTQIIRHVTLIGKTYADLYSQDIS